jgi:hypothetical protein
MNLASDLTGGWQQSISRPFNSQEPFRFLEASGHQQVTNYASFQGLFSAEKGGHFAEKPGSHGKYFTLFFAFFRFFQIFPVATHCLPGTSGGQDPPK